MMMYQESPEYLDYLARVQCDLKSIRDLHIDEWDGDRVLAFAKQLAIRSRVLEDGKTEADVTKELEWAILNACITRMDTGALRQLSVKVSEWHGALRGVL